MRHAKKANKVYEFIRRGIEMGTFRVGGRIPTERYLAGQFGFSCPTVSGAIHRLVRKQLIRRSGKAGSVVIATPPRRSLTFGAILIMLGGQQQEDSIFVTVGNELKHRAGMNQSVVLLRDPSWGDDPGEPGLANRYQEIADQFMARKVDGVFLMPQEILTDQSISASTAIAEDIKEAGATVVLIDNDIMRYPKRSQFDLVAMDNFGAAYMLAEHFLNLGCRRIDFMGQLARNPTQHARIAGYQQALKDRGIPYDSASVHYGNLHDRGFVLQTLQRRKPEAVLVISDFRAAFVMRFALQAGIKIPEDLRMGSFDDLPLASHLPVPLTTIRQSAPDIGAAAYHTMLRRIMEPDMSPMNVQLSGKLIVRASSGPRLAAKTDHSATVVHPRTSAARLRNPVEPNQTH